jgi:hypothetical protein
VNERKAEMSELRKKIADWVTPWLESYTLESVEPHDALQLADRILALPEIANGLQLLAAHKDALFDGTGLVRITRLAAEDVRIDPSA